MKKNCHVKASPSPTSSPIKKCKTKSSQQKKKNNTTQTKNHHTNCRYYLGTDFSQRWTHFTPSEKRTKRREVLPSGKHCWFSQFLDKLSVPIIFPSNSNHNTQRTFLCLNLSCVEMTIKITNSLLLKQFEGGSYRKECIKGLCKHRKGRNSYSFWYLNIISNILCRAGTLAPTC